MSDFLLGCLLIILGLSLLLLVLRVILAYWRLRPHSSEYSLGFMEGYHFSPFFRNFDYAWVRFLFSPICLVIFILVCTFWMLRFSPQRVGVLARVGWECHRAATPSKAKGWQVYIRADEISCKCRYKGGRSNPQSYENCRDS